MAYRDVILASSPSLYWRLVETTGTVAADELGLGRTGTFAGSPTLNSPLQGSRPNPGGVRLSGASQTITATDTSIGNFLGSDSFSIEFWIDRWSSGTICVQKWSTLGWKVESNSNSLQLALSNGTRSITKRFDYQTQANNWVQYIVATYDGTATQGGMRMWANGVEITAVASIGAITLLTTDSLSNAVGISSIGNSSFGISLAEIAVYTRVLSPTEIADHYSASAPSIAVRPVHAAGENIHRSVSRPARNILPASSSSTGSARRNYTKINPGLN